MVAHSLSEEEIINIDAARFSVVHEGRILPVTNMFDMWGDQLGPVNYLQAFGCVAYDPSVGWLVLSCKPGELAPWRGKCGNQSLRH